MKTIALAAAITLGATSAFAGSMDTMAMDAAPMVEAAQQLLQLRTNRSDTDEL